MSAENELSSDHEESGRDSCATHISRDASDTTPIIEAEMSNYTSKVTPVISVAFHTYIRDPDIFCSCPLNINTNPAPEDLQISKYQDRVVWYHKPCESWRAEIRTDLQNIHKRIAEGVHLTTAATDSPLLAGPLSKLLKFLNVQFDCDCERKIPYNDLTSDDLISCSECDRQQHTECILWGEECDHGPTVCNQCWTKRVVFREEYIKWQRHRYRAAARTALHFIQDPLNQHKTWELAFSRGFYDTFIAKRNQSRTSRSTRSSAAQSIFYELEMAPKKQSVAPKKQSVAPKKQAAAPKKASAAPRKQSAKAAGKRPVTESANLVKDEPVESRPVRGAARKYAPGMTPSNHPTQAQNDKDVLPKKGILKTTESKKRKRAPEEEAQAVVSESATTSKKRKQSPVIAANEEQVGESSQDISKSTNGDEKRVQLPVDAANAQTLRDRIIIMPPYRPGKGKKAVPQPNMRCRCPPGSDPQIWQSFQCNECDIRQHRLCSNARRDQSSTTAAFLCNHCFRAVPKDHIDPGVTKKWEANMRLEVRLLCTGVIWKEWRDLPVDGTNASSSAAAEHLPPPLGWLDEMQDRLMKLFLAAGPQTTKYYLGPDLATFPRDYRSVVASLRVLADWMVRQGPYKGKREELGLLAEVLGMVKKGAAWAPKD